MNRPRQVLRSSAIPTNFAKQRAGKITVGMSSAFSKSRREAESQRAGHPPALGGIKIANNSRIATSVLNRTDIEQAGTSNF